MEKQLHYFEHISTCIPCWQAVTFLSLSMQASDLSSPSTTRSQMTAAKTLKAPLPLEALPANATTTSAGTAPTSQKRPATLEA